MADVTMDKLVSLCKRRGFIFQSSEIYGGQGGAWDYGPLGVELKNNIKRAWWRANVLERPDMVGLDAAILMHPRVWEASGHVGHFADPMVDCRACKQRFRADDLTVGQLRGASGPVEIDIENALAVISDDGFVLDNVKITGHWPGGNVGNEATRHIQFLVNNPNWTTSVLIISTDDDHKYYQISGPIPHYVERLNLIVRPYPDVPAYAESISLELNSKTNAIALTGRNVCPNCGSYDLTEPRMFNLMFKTFVGPVEDTASQVYLRPETAQGIFANFGNVLTATRRKLPFGIAQIGKAFRNEITPGNFVFRSREFEQMEIEFFVRPGADEEWHRRWIQDRLAWYTGLGMDPAHLRLRVHQAAELAHYSKGTTDVDYLFPMGWSELEGIANRTDYDLRQHSEFSGERLTYFDEEANEHIVPYVIEPSAGVDRSALAFLLDAYREEEVPSTGPSTSSGQGRGETRVLLRLHQDLAPVKVAVLPLSRNEKLLPTAQEVDALLRKGLRDTMVQYDDAQSIGRRYRRQDEIGTPYCVTVDFESLEDRAVTIRERDEMTQERVPIAELAAALRERLES
ncbi:MAG: glycine--tRNA ligase [Chloroflexi bacterium]|nr:glycine--tRNA ligase [Chloroflexota bacterium]